MMRKVNITISSCLVLLLMLMLTCCNPSVPTTLYEWNLSEYETDTADGYKTLGGNATSYKSYIYFINGYEQNVTNNQWGVPEKNTIVRASYSRDGNFSNEEIIVPKRVLTKDEGGGFAIINDWIYYATPSTNADGSTSSTHIDFMRTKIDAKVTQLLATVEGRDIDYFFMSNRVLYKRESESTVEYIDFSGVDDSQSTNRCDGVERGTFLENVQDVSWNYASESEYIYYTTMLTGDGDEQSNTLNRIKYDGSGEEILIDKSSFLEQEEEDCLNEASSKTYQIELEMHHLFGSTGKIEYIKKFIVNGQVEEQGYYCCEIEVGAAFDLSTEKCITNEVDDSSVIVTYCLSSIVEAVIKKNDGKLYHVVINEEISQELITDSCAKVVFADQSVVYYVGTDGKLYAHMISHDVTREVLSAPVNTNWDDVEVFSRYVGWFTSIQYIMYFDESDSNNSYVISLENMWVTMDFVTYETIVPYKVGVEE